MTEEMSKTMHEQQHLQKNTPNLQKTPLDKLMEQFLGLIIYPLQKKAMFWYYQFRMRILILYVLKFCQK